MDPEHRKEKAAQCRRLASYLPPGDPARAKLLQFAEEYENEAEGFGGERRHDHSLEC
jgi:hypothetical protein